MSTWMKLIDYPDEYIKCGATLRVPSSSTNRENWYRDDIIDLMVFYAGAAFEDAAYGLISVSGHKAGRINTTFLKESGDENGNGLRRDWLIENWSTWVYIDGNARDVWIKDPESVSSMPDGWISAH